MLNFGKVVNEVVRDNEISFCGISYMLSDDEILKVKSIIEGMLNEDTKVSTPSKKDTGYHPVDEKKATQSTSVAYPGTPVWQEDFVTVTLIKGIGYRVYIHCPLSKERHGEYIREKIKQSAKSFGAKFSGNYDAKEFHWTFQNRDDAMKFIESRKQYAKDHKKG